MKNRLINEKELNEASRKLNEVYKKLNECLFGREELHRSVLTAVIAKGHVLLEGLPGLGKTALVTSLSELLDLKVNRIQFTPDLMPSDILGSHILQGTERGKREMIFQPGPVFCNFLLGDEINRASPKTQSALLEAMQEKTITLMGETHKLPDPFFVLATQNPIELEGTYPLPEAQMDRFLFKINIDNLDTENMERIITERHHGIIPEQKPVIKLNELNSLFNLAGKIIIPKAVANYIARLVGNTNPDLEIEGISSYIKYGASPRAAISIAEAARAAAMLAGRPSVGFDDVDSVAVWAMQHRIVLEYRARSENITQRGLVNTIIEKTKITNQELPKSVSYN
jgi:MoxR-like ATPase